MRARLNLTVKEAFPVSASYSETVELPLSITQFYSGSTRTGSVTAAVTASGIGLISCLVSPFGMYPSEQVHPPDSSATAFALSQVYENVRTS